MPNMNSNVFDIEAKKFTLIFSIVLQNTVNLVVIFYPCPPTGFLAIMFSPATFLKPLDL